MPDYPFSNNDVTPSIFMWALVDCGPTLGNVRRPIFAERIITAAGDVYVQPFDFQIVIKKTIAAITTVFLPNCATWMKNKYGGMPILIKDGSNNASRFNITITPDGTDEIDLLSSFTIAGDGGSLMLRPLTDLSGWSTS